MILVDTSVWVDHLRKGDPAMQELLDQGRVISHPLVIGELAMGDLRPREPILRALDELSTAVVGDHAEVLRLISERKLYGLGIGFIDVHLLAAALLTPAKLWTRDKRLAKVAEALGFGFTV